MSAAGEVRPPGDNDADLLRGVASYYAARYHAHGDSARGMDWKDEASQRLRFEVLARQLDLAGSPSLLDVGCGNGELLAFLRERGADVRYRGIDVCPEMVEACRRRFGPEAAEVASTAELARRSWTADYVVASGTFNVKQDVSDAVWERYLRRAVREMFAACRRAAVFNVMSARVDMRYDHLYYLDPSEVPALADLCPTRRFLLDHSYPLFEMTVALLR
jgi:cyclopropane fatty-acyl-phospholipid synthase-like methyltransferase